MLTHRGLSVPCAGPGRACHGPARAQESVTNLRGVAWGVGLRVRAFGSQRRRAGLRPASRPSWRPRTRHSRHPLRRMRACQSPRPTAGGGTARRLPVGRSRNRPTTRTLLAPTRTRGSTLERPAACAFARKAAPTRTCSDLLEPTLPCAGRSTARGRACCCRASPGSSSRRAT